MNGWPVFLQVEDDKVYYHYKCTKAIGILKRGKISLFLFFYVSSVVHLCHTQTVMCRNGPLVIPRYYFPVNRKIDLPREKMIEFLEGFHEESRQFLPTFYSLSEYCARLISPYFYDRVHVGHNLFGRWYPIFYYLVWDRRLPFFPKYPPQAKAPGVIHQPHSSSYSPAGQPVACLTQ